MQVIARTLFVCSLLAALAGCTVFGGGRSTTPTRLALVIGNSNYDNAPALRNPQNDADDMCKALARMDYRTLCHKDVRDRADFDARVREYVELLGPKTVGVVYYSGHGVQARGANYLIPTRAQMRSVAEDPTRVLYGLDDLFERLREKRTKLQFVVLDACRTDLFTAGPKDTRSALVRSLQTAAGASNGMRPITDAPPGTAVLYATASGDTSYDGRGRNGAMTQVLLRHLGSTGKQVKDLIDAVIKGVQEDTQRDYPRPMTPFSYGSFDGEVCLGGCRIPPPPILPN